MALGNSASDKQCIGNVLLRDIFAGGICGGLFPLIEPRLHFNRGKLLFLFGQTEFFGFFGSKGKLLHLRLRRGFFDGNNQPPLFNKCSNFCGCRIPCQIDLCRFGKIVALPQFQIHIMPDKTYEMVVYEQLRIDWLIAMLTKGAALGKVGVFGEILQNSRIVGAAGGFLCQKSHDQFLVQWRQVAFGHRKSGGRVVALR